MKDWAWIQAKWLSWDVGGPHWGIRFQAQWRWWARRWGFALTACGLAWGLGLWLHAPTWLAHAELKSEVQSLQDQLAAAPVVRAQLAGAVVSDDVNRLPAADQHEQVWTHLQKILLQHRVRLMGMQPVNDVEGAPLPSQAMTLRLQARFENWAGVWASLVDMGPVWSMDRLRVVPSAGQEGVDIEVVWRAWFNPALAGSNPPYTPLAGGSPNVPQGPFQKHGASVFDTPDDLPSKWGRASVTGAKPPTGAAVGVLPDAADVADIADSSPKDLVFSNEPERWPMLPMRVIGIWRQGEQAEAVVANATHWFRTQEGRLLSLEGHRVWRIGRDDIQVRDPAGRVQTFSMEARAP